MTITDLLGMDVAKLEAMSDEELTGYLRPYITAIEPDKKQRIPNTVIDVTGSVERAEKKKESVDEYIKRMTAMMTAKNT